MHRRPPLEPPSLRLAGRGAARISRCGNAEERFPLTVQPHTDKKKKKKKKKSKCGTDFHGITKDGCVAGRSDGERDEQIH